MSISHNYHLRTDQNQITIQVCSPTQVKQTLSTYTIYTIKGSDIQGDFSLTRRYSDFDHIRQSLLLKWPGCFIPILPPKKVIGNNDQLFILQRLNGLNSFCEQISGLKHLWYSKQFQILIRSEKKDLEKVLKQMDKVSQGNNKVEDIINKYREVMDSLKHKPNQQYLSKTINQFQIYIRKVLPIISTFKDTARAFSQSSTSYLDQFNLIYTYIFPQFEKNLLSTYIMNQQSSQKLIFFNSIKNQKITNLIEQLKKTIQKKNMGGIYRLLDKEQRQLETFLQIFKIKQNNQSKLKSYHNKQKQLLSDQAKLQAGKQSPFHSLIKTSIQQQKSQLQKQLLHNKRRIQQYSQLNELIQIILKDYQIPRFKQIKLKQYNKIMKQMCQFEKKLAEIREQICVRVLDEKQLENVLVEEIE